NDGVGCLADVFTVNVSSAAQSITLSENLQRQTNPDNTLRVYPTILSRGQILHVSGVDNGREYIISDIHGRIIKKSILQTETYINTGAFFPGVYFIKWTHNNVAEARKFIIIN